MGHRSPGATHAALTAVGALLVTGLPAAFAAEPPTPAAEAAASSRPAVAAPAPEAGKPSAALLHALQRDLHLTPRQARERLSNEADAGARAGHLQIALGEHFAGAWVRGGESEVLTVATTDAADAPAIESAGAEAHVVPYGLGELRDAAAKLDRAAAGAKALDTPVRYVDIRSNRVTVQAVTSGAAEALIAAAGVDRALVDISLSPERPRALYDIVGGDAFYVEAGRCSVGFSVTKGDTQGFATAGHCGTPGTATTGFNQVAQGTFQASVFPGQDMAWVKTGTDWTATPKVKGAGGEAVQVAGSTQVLVGAAVCRSGSTSGWHCGEVEQHDTSVTYRTTAPTINVAIPGTRTVAVSAWAKSVRNIRCWVPSGLFERMSAPPMWTGFRTGAAVLTAIAARNATNVTGEFPAMPKATGTTSPTTRIAEDSTFDITAHRYVRDNSARNGEPIPESSEENASRVRIDSSTPMYISNPLRRMITDHGTAPINSCSGGRNARSRTSETISETKPTSRPNPKTATSMPKIPNRQATSYAVMGQLGKLSSAGCSVARSLSARGRDSDSPAFPPWVRVPRDAGVLACLWFPIPRVARFAARSLISVAMILIPARKAQAMSVKARSAPEEY